MGSQGPAIGVQKQGSGIAEPERTETSTANTARIWQRRERDRDRYSPTVMTLSWSESASITHTPDTCSHIRTHTQTRHGEDGTGNHEPWHIHNPKWEIFTKSQEEMKGLTLILSSLEIKFNSTGGLKNLCSWKSASWSETPVYLDVAAVVKRLCCFVAHLRDTIKSTKNGTRKPYLNSFSRKGNQCMHGFILYKQISWKFRIWTTDAISLCFGSSNTIRFHLLEVGSLVIWLEI